MNLGRCPQEAAVLDALRGGRLTGDLEAHVEGCPACAEAAAVAAGLSSLQHALDRKPLPDPRRIWREAARQARRDAARRATRVLELTRVAALVAAAATVGLAALRWWPDLRHLWQEVDLSAAAVAPATFLHPAPALAALVAAVFLVGLSAVRSAWLEE